MRELRIHGRGGRGAVIASKLLASAPFREGNDVWSFPNGERWSFSVDHPGEPVAPYLKMQGRFRHPSDEDIAKIQKDVDTRWGVLERRVGHGT